MSPSERLSSQSSQYQHSTNDSVFCWLLVDPDQNKLLPVTHEEYISWLEDSLCHLLKTCAVGPGERVWASIAEDLIKLSEPVASKDDKPSTSYRDLLWKGYRKRSG